MRFKNFGHDGDCRIDWVEDDKDKCIRAIGRSAIGEIANDSGVNLE
jgi:hypothetical protein